MSDEQRQEGETRDTIDDAIHRAQKNSAFMRRPDIRPRVTIVERVYYLPPDSEGIDLSSQFSRELLSDEQPFRRTFKLGSEWKPLDLGWVPHGQCGMILLVNEEGKGLQAIPTLKEQIEIAARVVEIGARLEGDTYDPFALIRPGEHLRFCPASTEYLYLRCRSESARITLFAIPA